MTFSKKLNAMATAKIQPFFGTTFKHDQNLRGCLFSTFAIMRFMHGTRELGEGTKNAGHF